LRPDEDPIAHAEALIAADRAGEAALLLSALLRSGRGGLLMRLTLVKALREAGDARDALAAAREAASLHPGVAVVAVALGEAMLAAGLLPTAIGEFQRALRLDPESADARRALGRAWLDAGEPDKALETLASLDDVDALRAGAEAMKRAPRSNANYVRHLFDQFSADYDARMIGQLGYRAPAILRELFDLTAGTRGLAVLDLGCGTGLSGAAFRDAAARLVGVDLSPAMIEKARARGIYDELAVADLETALDGTQRYGLILAADTLVYLGDLSAVFAGVARSLEAEGRFLFTVERKQGDGFDLGPKRRWRHSEAYLRDQAAAAGLNVAGLLECSPRSEAGQAVPGLAAAFCLAGKVG